MMLLKINLLNTPFNEQLPVAQLHWIISDSEESITVEAVKEGIIDEVGGIHDALVKLHAFIDASEGAH